jgi:hypothetical protein
MNGYVGATVSGRDTPLPGDVQTLLHGVGRLIGKRVSLASLLYRLATSLRTVGRGKYR